MPLILLIILTLSINAFAQETIDIQRIDENSYSKTVVINKTFEDLDLADESDDQQLSSLEASKEIYQSKIDETDSSIKRIKDKKSKRQQERMQATGEINFSPVEPLNEGVNWN